MIFEVDNTTEVMDALGRKIKNRYKKLRYNDIDLKDLKFQFMGDDVIVDVDNSTGRIIFKTTVTTTTGPTINAAINKSATSFARSTTAPISTIATTDISEKQDKSIVTWYDTTSTIQYYYSDSDVIYLNPDSSKMFYDEDETDINQLKQIDLSSFNTSKVTDMSFMFYGRISLTSLDVTHFNTSKVTDMQYMFCDCELLTSLDVSSFDTSNVINMEGMFNDCMNLTSLDVSNFDTSNVTTMRQMFGNCDRLTSLNVSGFDTSKVTNMNGMFYSSWFASLDLSNFDTSNVTDMSDMFSWCESLTSLDVSHFNTSNVTTMGSMFYSCSVLTSLNLSDFNTSKVTDMSKMFNGDALLTTITYGNNFVDTALLNAAVSTYENDTYRMFNLCPANKPTWTGGNWTEDGTFVLTTIILSTGPTVNAAINKSATSFTKSPTPPDTGGVLQ